MSDEESGATELISPPARRWVWFSALFVLGAMLVVTVVTSRQLAANKQQAIQRHADLFEQTEADALPSGAKPTEIFAGIYLDRIAQLSIKDVQWQVDFYIWFRWNGDAIQIGNDFGESFRIVNGAVDSAELDKRVDEGETHYVRYRVVATISKFFDLKRYSLDDHLLSLNVEPRALPREALKFIADEQQTGLSSRVKITSFRIMGHQITERAHAYQTTLGDPQLTQETKAVYSQLRYGLPIEREGWGYFVKMFQGLFASIAVALVAMFVKPTDVDPRFGLGVGAFFAAMANTYITSGLIPETSVTTLADLINGLGMAMIFLTIVQSAVSLYLYDIRGRHALSRYFDWVSFWVFLVGAFVFNCGMPYLAKL